MAHRPRNFPRSSESQLIAHALWTRNRQDVPEGIYTHETALAIHELSDSMPAKLSMTVPPTFRRFAQPPKVLKLHFADIDPRDVEQRRGFKVSRPLKTILDLMASESISPGILEKAFVEAIERGLIPIKDVLSQKNPIEVRTQFDKWLKRMRHAGSKEAG